LKERGGRVLGVNSPSLSLFLIILGGGGGGKIVPSYLRQTKASKELRVSYRRLLETLAPVRDHQHDGELEKREKTLLKLAGQARGRRSSIVHRVKEGGGFEKADAVGGELGAKR